MHANNSIARKYSEQEEKRDNVEEKLLLNRMIKFYYTFPSILYALQKVSSGFLAISATASEP